MALQLGPGRSVDQPAEKKQAGQSNQAGGPASLEESSGSPPGFDLLLEDGHFLGGVLQI